MIKLYFNFGQMPRPSSCDKDALTKVILAARDAIVGGQDITHPSGRIWTDRSKQLGGKMSPKGLYTYVKMNRHNIWEQLGLTNAEEAHEESDNSDLDLDSPPETHNSTEFELTIPYDEWTQKFLDEAVYKDTQSHERSYTVFRRGMWTHALNKKIWETIKSPCTLCFKRAKVYPNSLLR